MLQAVLKSPVRLVYRLFPSTRLRLRGWKARLERVATARFHWSDARHSLRHMVWRSDDNRYWKLSAELIFQYHKLEKGLSIGGPRRFFGLNPVLATCGLVERWRRAGLSLDDPVFVGAIEALRSYRRRLDETPAPPDQGARVLAALERCLAYAAPSAALATPQPYRPAPEGAASVLDQLLASRRSVRAYSNEPVSIADLHASIAAAQLSPSACNRQPWRVHVYRDQAQIRSLLELQNGNTGFGHMLSTLLVVAADADCFFDASERQEPYIDGGLFAMSLILSLQARGLASCCLNWCVTPQRDAEAHRRGAIPDSQRIVMYMAVGHAAEGALVPRSPRRTIDSMTVWHAAPPAAPGRG
jgi:nitroreductase